MRVRVRVEREGEGVGEGTDWIRSAALETGHRLLKRCRCDHASIRRAIRGMRVRCMPSIDEALPLRPRLADALRHLQGHS